MSRVALLAVLTLALLAAACSSSSGGPQPLPTTTDPGPPTLAADELPPIPAGLPNTLQLGMANRDGLVETMPATARFGYRYQYLTGPAEGEGGWTTWTHVWSGEDEIFIPFYIYEAQDFDMVPVFTYYVLLQSTEEGGSEAERLADGLRDRDIMKSYYEALRRFFEESAEATDRPVILHVEPDLWGFMQSRSNGNDPATVPAAVASTGIDALEGLPDTLSGFAQAIAHLRDQYAPNVLLALHASTWATGDDFIYTDPPDAAVSATAAEVAAFFRRLGAGFDLLFAEFSDRDAGFKEFEYGDRGASWFDAGDFHRHALFIAELVKGTGLRAVLWQIPYGNTSMRAQDNSWNHYQDNRVEWLLDDGSAAHLQEYADAGVIGLLFGRGAEGATDASDAAEDGITNPEPINGNAVGSLSADDDGGLFRVLAARYYESGPLQLP